MQVEKVAFFDVDETIINCKSMFDFQQFFLIKKYGFIGKILFILSWKIIKILSVIGVDRVKINAIYYKFYKGKKYDLLMEMGLDWFNSRKNMKDFFKEETLELINNLQSEGVKIFFISGSFKPCLEPIRYSLNADEILCAELETRNGYVTGRLIQKAIGKSKAKLVNEYLIKNNISSDDCYAVGDHISDLDMLSLVGNPVVVRNCELLEKEAKINNWKIIE